LSHSASPFFFNVGHFLNGVLLFSQAGLKP
jgi:hypothetical protein